MTTLKLERITKFMSMQGFTVCRAYYSDDSTLIISVDDAEKLSKSHGIDIQPVDTWSK